MANVRVLGPFEATVGETRADLGGPRQRSVLARLVAAGGDLVTADRLIADLWPGEAPPRAAAGLQSFVSHLRRALEPDRPPRTPARVLVTAPPGYALRLPDDQVDAWRFAALTDRAGTHLAAGEGDAALRAARAALAEWRGPAYAEFADLPWAAAEAARLAELRLLAVERRAGALLAVGSAAEAVPDLEAHTAAHPLREDAWRLLGLALYRAGRQGDALAALRRARAVLTEELGVDPGPALRDLERDILAQSPELAPARPALTVVTETVRRDATFVGRAAELDRLADAAEQARAGRCTLVLVAGDAGMGKTALTERFAGTLTGWTRAFGRAPETGGAPAAWPWAELLRSLAAGAPPDDDLAARLAPLLDDVPSGGDAQTGRFRLNLAVAAYLGGLAARTPLLLVLDDLHWADEETLTLLTELPGRLRDRPVLLVGAYRGTEIPARLATALAALARHEPHRLDLAGLSAGETAELLRAACATRLDAAAVTAIAERTGGNPFFARETARLLDAEGPDAAAREVPAGVGDVLRRRIARLPDAAQHVLRVAAVAGRDADLDVLADACDADEDAVIDTVEAGLAAGLVTEPGPGRVRFAHALVRDTLLTGLSQARRTRLHGVLAAALERRRPGDAAALAHHHLAWGGDPGRAVRHARLAAEAAEARFAHAAAADLWCRAADLPGDVRDRLDLEAAAIRASALAGKVEDARARRQAALPAALALGDPVVLARVLVAFVTPTLWTTHVYGTVDTEIVAAVGRALDALPAAEGALRVRLLTVLAMETEGEPGDTGPRAAREAVALARDLGDPELLAVALNGQYLNCYQDAAQREDRWEIATELRALAAGHGLPAYESLAHLLLHQTAVARLDLAAAAEHAAAGRRLSREYGLPLLEALGGWHRGLAHVVAGRLDDAEREYVRTGEHTSRSTVWNSARGMQMAALFGIRLVQGRVAETADAAGWLAEEWPHVGAVADIHALALHARGRTADAHRVAARAGRIRHDYLRDLSLGLRGLRALALGDRATAAAVHADLLPYRDQLAGGACAVVAIGPAAQILGDLAAFLDRPDEAAGHYRAAACVSAAVGSARWERDAAEALRALGVPAA
ncbi:BTAD domain-containing putative transcriptional regulator [Actinomadura rayongensis]|uniref:AAA family ATPase n=1 Tax=Actinomadura rayongensis TaxID=1429076 RepID=A0A6I4W2X5_9ACTN|nr:BTAD domain-containing putative transcriptional regulator [Actinomadura rayongensis]MXQ63718.1 AAA family ATPase [Actinomadura rayongensis]